MDAGRETTIKVYKKDALILKQVQNFLEMREHGMTQAEFVHKTLEFLLDYQEDFLKEIESMRARHEKMYEEWMKTLLRRAQERL